MRHAGPLFALIEGNRVHLREWLVWVGAHTSVESNHEFIKRSLQQFANGDGPTAGIWLGGELAGTIDFNYLEWLNRRTEIGYWLGESFQGKGLMTRACRALIDHAFTELGLNRIEIFCAVENTRGRAIPERLGFIQEGVPRQANWLYDHFVDIAAYGMLAAEWGRGDRQAE